jgi:hypothetical protein
VSARRHHGDIYAALRAGHPKLFADLHEHRSKSDLSRIRKLLYPIVYGERRLRGVRFAKPLLDRAGVWTQRR